MGQNCAEKMILEFGESKHPVFGATSPLSRGQLKSKSGGKLSIHYCADLEAISSVFRTIISENQLSLYGAVAEMCEEYESYHAGRPVVGEQSSSSFVPNVINTNVPLNNDDPTRKELLLQKYGERIEKLSQQDNLSKVCTDAGFLTVVEVGQYFMTKTRKISHNSQMQWPVVSALCQETKIHLNRKVGFEGTPKLVLEVATCYLQGKCGVEIRIMSVNEDNSHSWVRISHGLNKLVTDLNNNDQETSEMQFGENALRLNASDFASRSKAKAKPQKRYFASSFTRSVPIGERTWTDVEPGK